jgi:hypothetical protein
MLTKDAILAANDLRIESVDVPEWGGAVGVRVMDGESRDKLDAFLARAIDKDGRVVNPQGLRTMVAVLCCCDAVGAPLFTDKDVAALARKSSAALDRVWKAASALNGLGGEAVEAARQDFFDGQKSASGSE